MAQIFTPGHLLKKHDAGGSSFATYSNRDVNYVFLGKVMLAALWVLVALALIRALAKTAAIARASNKNANEGEARQTVIRLDLSSISRCSPRMSPRRSAQMSPRSGCRDEAGSPRMSPRSGCRDEAGSPRMSARSGCRERANEGEARHTIIRLDPSSIPRCSPRMSPRRSTQMSPRSGCGDEAGSPRMSPRSGCRDEAGSPRMSPRSGCRDEPGNIPGNILRTSDRKRTPHFGIDEIRRIQHGI